MAFLDVTSTLLDPDFTDPITVLRRTEAVGINGRSTTANQPYVNVIAVVQPIGPSDLDRREDYQSMTRSISVVTKFRLQGETTDCQPDIVIWQGSNYVVKHIKPYAQYGAGFIEAECTSMDLTDPLVP